MYGLVVKFHVEEYPRLRSPFQKNIAGMTVLEPFIAYKTVRLPADAFDELAARYIARLKDAPTSTPLRYRSENGGDYRADGVVKDDIADAVHGLAVHSL